LNRKEFWLKQFPGEIPLLDLPTDFPRQRVQRFAGDILEERFSRDLSGKIKEMALESSTTVYMVLLAAYYILLSRYSGQEDIVVGTPTAGRRHPDLEFLNGMFVNTLALRNYPSGAKTFKEFLEEVKTNTLNAFENQDFQFEELVSTLGIRRDSSRNVLFDTMFAMITADMRKVDRKIRDITIKPYKFQRKSTPFDIVLYASETGKANNSLDFDWLYSTALYKRETIERWSKHFANIVREVTTSPGIKISKIQMFDPGEEELLFQSSQGELEDQEVNFDF
jgi:non-ribosomal peptide synthetase component F